MMKKHQFCERKALIQPETSFGSSSSSSFIQPTQKAPTQVPTHFNKSRFSTMEQSSGHPNSSMRGEEEKAPDVKPSHSKKENLLHLKSKYFSKLTELN